MVAYPHFLALCHSPDAEQRAQAAHMVASAYIGHEGPMDERAALYAQVLGFLEDSSVKVRAALAFGLLHSQRAPRIVMLSLIKDAPVIARAVIQYSPVLLDVDLLGVVGGADDRTLMALAGRARLSPRLVRALVERRDVASILHVLERHDLDLEEEVFAFLAGELGHVARVRGGLLARSDLPAFWRLKLIEQVRQALCGCRIVKGAVAPERLERLTRDALDHAATHIGEEQSAAGNTDYCERMRQDERLNTRLLLHAIINGRVLFFADAIGLLSQMPGRKVFSLLENGSRVALNALFARCGMGEALRNLLARLVMFARSADLSNDEAARHFVVTAMVEELIIEHDGDIPQSLEEAFRYLDEQNMVLACAAARGVMPGFARGIEPDHQLAVDEKVEQMLGHGRPVRHFEEEQLALPAA